MVSFTGMYHTLLQNMSENKTVQNFKASEIITLECSEDICLQTMTSLRVMRVCLVGETVHYDTCHNQYGGRACL